MIKLRRRDDRILWLRAGRPKPAPTDKRSLELACKELDLPPERGPDKVVL